MKLQRDTAIYDSNVEGNDVKEKRHSFGKEEHVTRKKSHIIIKSIIFTSLKEPIYEFCNFFCDFSSECCP